MQLCDGASVLAEEAALRAKEHPKRRASIASRRMRVSTRTRPSLRARACLDRREDARRRLSGAGFSQARCKLNPRKCIQRGAGRSRCTYLRDGLFEGTGGGAIVLHNLWVMKARVRGRQHPAWSRSRVDARMRSAEKTWQRQARAAMPGKRRRRRRSRRPARDARGRRGTWKASAPSYGP